MSEFDKINWNDKSETNPVKTPAETILKGMMELWHDAPGRAALKVSEVFKITDRGKAKL